MSSIAQLFRNIMNHLIEWADTQHFSELSQFFIDFRDQPDTFVVPVLCIVAAVWFVSSSKFHRLLHALGILLSPREITIEPLDIELKELCAGARRLIVQLHKLGFEKAGTFHVRGSIVMVVFLKNGVGAVVYEQNDYPWYDIYAHLADGSGIGVTDNFKMKNVPNPPQRDYIVTDDEPKDSYDAFMARVEQQNQRIYPIDTGNFVSMFESVYADDMVWRKSQLNVQNLLKSLVVNSTQK